MPIFNIKYPWTRAVKRIAIKILLIWTNLLFNLAKYSECIICLNAMSKPEDMMRLTCKHEYHRKCISEWFKEKRECPMCRNYDVNPEEYPPLNALKIKSKK